MQKGGYYGTDIGFGLTAQEGITGKNQAAEEMKAEPEKIDFSNVKIEPLFEIGRAHV